MELSEGQEDQLPTPAPTQNSITATPVVIGTPRTPFQSGSQIQQSPYGGPGNNRNFRTVLGK